MFHFTSVHKGASFFQAERYNKGMLFTGILQATALLTPQKYVAESEGFAFWLRSVINPYTLTFTAMTIATRHIDTKNTFPIC